MHVLFVCTGNICRSPTAERLTAMYAAQKQLQNLKASSAGTRAVIARPIHGDAARVLANLGGDTSDFAARQLTRKIAAGADLILTMTKAHRAAVLELAPNRLHRTFTLTEASLLVSRHRARSLSDLSAFRSRLPADDAFEVPDPIGQGAEYFSLTGARISSLLPPILELCHEA